MPKQILLVDDNRMLVQFLTKLLEQQGYTVASAPDGFEALNLLASMTPDVLIVDLIMPRIGGDKLCQIVRRMPQLDSCFIIVLSAALVEMKSGDTHIGADAYIAKGPFGTMAEHVLSAVASSDVRRPAEEDKALAGGVFHRRVTRELLSRSRHLETVLESIDEGILEVYAGKIIFANSSAVTLLGKPMEHLLGVDFRSLFDDSARPRVAALMADADTVQSMTIGLTAPIEIGGRAVSIKRLPLKGEDATTIVLLNDLTEKKLLELQLQHAQKMEAIGTIASGVAHNFRNTLAGILVNSQMIQMNHKKDTALCDNLERINVSVRRGAKLVERLLQFSRKQVKIDFKRINLSLVVLETYQIIKKSFAQNIVIAVDAPQQLPVLGDFADLNQALLNLANNARDAMTPAGGKLRITASQDGDMVRLTVLDTGIGMSPQTIAKCFDPFFTTKEIHQGTGLGLSTTYGIIKNHNGKIEVESEIGRGTIFTVWLPAYRSIRPEASECDVEKGAGSGQPVLIVDTLQKHQFDLAGEVARLGYSTRSAGAGQEALDICTRWQPKVVLINRMHIETDGIGLTERIQSVCPGARIVTFSHREDHPPANGDREPQPLYTQGHLALPCDPCDLRHVLST